MKSLRIDLRDPRLRGGRMDIAAQTDDPTERDERAASLVQLLATEKGRAIVERLRARKLTVADVHKAVKSLDLSSLEPKPDEEAPKVRPVMLGETIDAWLAWLEGQHRAEGTLETYRSILRGVEEEFGVKRAAGGKITADVAVGSILRSQGERWLTGPKATNGDKPWAPSSQNTAHAVVSQLWDRAMAEDEERSEKAGTKPTIARNFWRKQGSRKGVRGARIRKTRVEFLCRGEAARVLWTNRGTELAAWIAVGIYAGLRPGEIANLRRDLDVNLKKHTITVQDRKGAHPWRVKNAERGQRTVPMHPRLARWLRRHIAHGYAGSVYLFHQPARDEPMDRSEWRTWVKRALEAAGVRYGRKKDALTAHSTRHTFASWLTLADVHPLKIAALMGDTVEEVMNTYAHLIDADLDEAIRRL